MIRLIVFTTSGPHPYVQNLEKDWESVVMTASSIAREGYSVRSINPSDGTMSFLLIPPCQVTRIEIQTLLEPPSPEPPSEKPPEIKVNDEKPFGSDSGIEQ